MTDKLKPCPFCGGAASGTVFPKMDGDDRIRITAGCINEFGNCPVSPHLWRDTIDEATLAWNRRRVVVTPENFGETLVAAVQEAVDIHEGRLEPARVTTVQVPSPEAP